MSNMRRRNLIAAIILLLLCAGYAYLTANLPTRAIENTTQPSFFPWVVTVIMAVLSLGLLAQAFLPTISSDTPKTFDVPAKRLIYGLVLSVAYFVSLPTLGFVAANIPFFAGLMYLYGERRPLWIAAGSILISLIVFFLFREVFQILLPSGILQGVLR
ncbi:MAG: tripartite tricarboxylate transporter TctB family protein [Rhodospirillaceae bacterium]|nr:tripartite tricarboxylate transporter TctB family protein [Rhodospirillaceae bacterium]